jgi:hypothetical protein
MNFRKRVFLIASSLFAVTISFVSKVNAEEFPKDRPFFISPVENESLVVDSFGDDLPLYKTYSHLYNKNATFDTAQIRAKFQPENNNSFELHMQKDDNLCYGPDVTARNQMFNGIRAVIKRECKNTLNHIMEGEQIRVNNTRFCLEIKDGKLTQSQKMQYGACNGSNAQRFKLSLNRDQSVKNFNGWCYRKPDLFHYQYPCFYNMPPNAKSISWTGGEYATVTFRQPDIYESGKLTKEGPSTLRYLNPDEGEITIPPGTVKYDIAPWNVNSTTQFTIIVGK